jgi:hypothetical protein
VKKPDRDQQFVGLSLGEERRDLGDVMQEGPVVARPMLVAMGSLS